MLQRLNTAIFLALLVALPGFAQAGKSESAQKALQTLKETKVNIGQEHLSKGTTPLQKALLVLVQESMYKEAIGELLKGYDGLMYNPRPDDPNSDRYGDYIAGTLVIASAVYEDLLSRYDLLEPEFELTLLELDIDSLISAMLKHREPLLLSKVEAVEHLSHLIVLKTELGNGDKDYSLELLEKLNKGSFSPMFIETAIKLLQENRISAKAFIASFDKLSQDKTLKKKLATTYPQLSGLIKNQEK